MKNIITLLFGACVILACSGTTNNKEVAKETTKGSSEKISQCLAEKDYKYEELLTKEDIAKYVSIDEPSYAEKISQTTGKYGSCTYSWDSNRPKIEREIAGRTIPLSDNNQVTIKLLNFYTDEDLERNKQNSVIDLFDMGYKKLSQEEYNKLLANLEKKLGDKSKDLSRAKKMLDSRMNFKYKTVDDLGDRAYWKWNNYGIELVVLVGDASFTIISKTTGEKEISLKHAINFANEVLVKCSGEITQ